MGKYREFVPAPRLSRYVECYWSREDSEGTAAHRVLPDGCVDILFSADKGQPISLSLVGLMTTALTLEIEPGRFFFGVRFRPGMASAFIREAGQFNDKNEPLENVTTASARELLERLGEAESSSQMAQIINGFLRPLEPPKQSEHVLQQLSLIPESLDDFARETNFSTRQLRRVCLEHAGVSPKHLLRILRFRKTAQEISRIASTKAQPRWADFAVACGYYDQAHFIRECQHFTGETPGRYLQSLTGTNL
jgi:AraC-like DNA-binding protein